MGRGTTFQGQTPRGTPPLATRRSTKHKRPEYGEFLKAAHAAKQERKEERRQTRALRARASAP